MRVIRALTHELWGHEPVLGEANTARALERGANFENKLALEVKLVMIRWLGSAQLGAASTALDISIPLSAPTATYRAISALNTSTCSRLLS